LPVNRGVMVGCLLVGVKDSDSRFQEKPSQHRFVPGALAPGGKSRPEPGSQRRPLSAD
jgi:hypothetical protein